MVGTAALLSRTLVLPLRPALGFTMWWPVADPGDALDYCLDTTAWLADAGETIASFSATISPSDGVISLISSGFSGGVLTVRIAGGVSGTTYQVLLNLVLASGAKLVRAVALPVASSSAAALASQLEGLTAGQLPLTVGAYGNATN